MKVATFLKLVYQALVRRDPSSRFLLAERVSGLIDPSLKFSEFGRQYLEDADFLAYYCAQVSTTNFHSLDRKYALDQLVKLTTRIPGDSAECGVYEGASSYLICRRLQGSGKKHYLFDSFAGLSRPSTIDGSH